MKFSDVKNLLISMIYITISLTIFFNYGKSEEDFVISNFLQEYDLRVNKSEETCKFVDHPNLPENRRTLMGRNCMCDVECVNYKDCCKDSPYYDETEQKQPSEYRCSEFSGVYMIAVCPSEWNETDIANLCGKSLQPIGSNISVVVPVSNPLKRITYGNQYCAICNEEDLDALIWWDVGAICGKAPPGLLKNSSSTTTASPFYFFRRNSRKPIVDYGTYLNETDKISANAVYDFIDEEFVSKYNDSDFICKFEALLPKNHQYFTRTCVPFVRQECSKDGKNQSLAEECSSFTNIVYNKLDKQPYKNKACALCWDEKEENIDGFPRDVRKSLLAATLYGPSAVPGFHVKPMHGLSYATIVPSSDGYVHRLKPNKLFKPAG